MKGWIAYVAVHAMTAGVLLTATASRVLAQDPVLPQCNLEEVYYPKNIQFMGPVKSIDVGKEECLLQFL